MALRRRAAAARGASTGPPGNFVMGLEETRERTRDDRQGMHILEAAVRFNDDAVGRAVLQHRLHLHIVVGVEVNLGRGS